MCYLETSYERYYIEYNMLNDTCPNGERRTRRNDRGTETPLVCLARHPFQERLGDLVVPYMVHI